MNHIYKVVWSKVRGCYVVVAEIARSNGKTHSQKVVAVLGTALISSMLFTGVELLTAEAAPQTFGTGTTASGTDSIAAGNSTKASGANSIAAGNTTTASGSESIALGTHNTASGMSSIAFGGTYLQQTVRKDGKNYLVYQIGDNTYYKDGNNYYSTADDTQFTGNTSSAVAVMINGGNTASGTDSVAFGEGTKAIAKGAVAFGLNTQAGSTTGGQNSIAFGNYTQALGGRSVAFGEYTIANYNDSVAFGNDTRALSTGATAFGNRTRALAQYSTAWGNATVAADEESTAWGTDTIAGAKLDENGAVTNNYKINPKDKNEPVKQEQMDVHGNLAYTYTSAADNKVYTAGIKQMPIDSGGELHDYVVLAGQDGNTYVRDYQGSLWKVNVDANGKVTVDTTAGTKGKVYNGNGTNKTSLAKTTVNGKEVDITPDSVLKKAHEGGNGYDIVGYKDATAFGYSTEASGDYATAFGNDTQAAAAAATAFGTTTTASGANATAFGESSTASGEAATAFGISSTASGKNSFAALGGTASADNAAAIGSGAQAKLADSVALGSGAVADRQSGAKGYDVLTKVESTNTSTAWVSKANAIAVGNGSTLTRQITGVAAGSQDTDAVNVAQLKAAGFKVTTQKNGNISSSIINGDTLDFEGKDNAIVSTTKDSKTITVAVSKTPTFDSATFGTTDNEKVTIANGQVSAFNSEQKKRAAVGVDNQGNGTLFLVNDDLSQAHLYTQSSKETGNDGITRMYYTSSTDNGGEVNGVHTIAVLDDGINYVGDNYTDDKKSNKVVVKHKLNSTMDVTGGADTNNLSDNNIGVVATPAVEDDQGNITQKGKLEIKLNKDVTGLNTVTAGNVRIGNNPANTLKLTENGQETENTAPAGSYATGLDNKAWDTKNPSYVSGRAATEDQLAKVSGVVDKGLSFTTNTKDAANTTDNYKGYKVVNRQLGDTISIKAGDADPNMKYETKNLTSQIAENGDITISMADKPTFSEVTASSFNLSPKDTTTKDQAGNTASAQLNAHYRDASLNPKKNVTMADGSTGMVRLHYHDGERTVHDLATMDDGQIYAGDIKTDGTEDTTGFGRKMNEKTTINGGVKEKDNLTDNNIGVVSNSTDTLTVKLAKNLQNLESVQAGKTTIDDNGLTIKKSDDDSSKNIVVLGDKVAFGDNQVNHMGSGSDGTGADGKPSYNNLTNGANIGDVKNIANSTVQPVIDTVNKGWELDVNGTTQKAVTPTSPKVNLIQGQNITITGDTANRDNVTIATADDVQFNTVRVGGSKTDAGYTGGIVIGQQSGGDSANPDKNDYITGLKNINWDSTKIQSGRAATEDQLKKVADDIKQGTVAGDVYVTGGEVSYHTDGGTDNGQLTVNDGTGKLTLTENNKTSKVEITGLHDYYVTNGTVTDDGKTLELTRNDRDEKGNPQKISVDLSNVLKSDQHLVANPADGTNGKYTVDATTGTVTLKVKNGDTYDDITIGGFEGLGQGLKFGANKMAKDGGGNPVTNQLGSTIKIMGDGSKTLDQYSGKNLLTSVEQDDKGNTAVHVLMDKNISADGVTVGQAGKDGVAGADGEVGKAGTIGINGKDGKEGITTTIIHTEKGQPGENGATGKPGVDGKDITRIVYQNDQDKVDGKDGSHTVATLDDGLKFSGDDNKVITKKLNEQMQFVGGADKDKLTQNNIGINDLGDGKLTIQLVNTPDLGDKGNLKAGDAHIGWFNGDTLDMTKDGTNPSGNKAGAGSYATGLSNKDWNTDSPEYVSGRAATEDQLAKVSEAVNNLNTATSKRTVVTVNDKSNPATAKPKAGDYGDYDSTNGNLMIAAKDENGKTTYNIKLNDQLAIGQKGENGKDGKVTVETKGGTTVVIGHDGKDGELGRDGLFVTSKDGKDAVSISGKDGVGHIGLTGPKGADGKDGAFTDLSTILGTATLDQEKNEVKGKDDSTKDKASRIQYQTTVTAEDGASKTITHEVATMDDGLKFAGNDGKEVTKKLNSTLSLTGGMDEDAVAKASSKNLGVRQNASKDGLEIVMTDTPDFTKVTVGEGTDTTQKIIIGKQTVTGKKSDGNPSDKSQTGNYITGLDNKAWDKDNVVENRAATEGQLRDIAGSITNQQQGGGFALSSDEKGADKVVKQDLGKAIQIKGDTVYKADGTVEKAGNIKTSVDVANKSIKVELNKNVDLSEKGSLKAGETTINKDGVATNKVTIKDSTISISKDGINAGGKQITNVASGGDVGTNAANIDDVKRIAGNMKTEITNNVTDVTNKVTQMGDQVKQVKNDVTQLQQDVKNVKADRNYQGDDGADKKVNVKFGSFLSLTGGAKEADLTKEGNIGVVQKEVDDPANPGQKMAGLSVRLAKHLNLEKTTYESGEGDQKSHAEIDGNGLTINHKDASGQQNDVVVRGDKVSAGGNKVENVAPGRIAPDSTEAINGSQLAQRDQAIGKLGGAINNLDRRVDRVGAGAAALAALHPQDFDPDDKWDFAVGYGNYRGANAAAVGAFYRPNEDTTLSIGGTVGGGENMVNAGISFKFGQGNHVTNSRVAMAKEILALKDYVQKQDEKIEKLEALVGKQGSAAAPKRRSILFPDVPENHWAYAYVKKLADRGLLEGYPDGEFKGDRTITRYEFAAIFSRALENGASVDNDMERMSEEFEPEIRELSLNRFRVDRVEGKDNDRHKIERVRVNDRDELVKQKNGEQKKRYRDLYGSVIEKDAPADAAK